MAVSLGTTTVTALFLGTTSISSAYLGNTQVFGGSFTPLSLFSSGSQGIWLDPSDLPTMFSDRAGTTPVTAPGTLVGLRLDKSKGLVLGAELVTNGDFNANIDGWTAGGGYSASWDAAGELIGTDVGSSGGIRAAISVQAGKSYRVSGTMRRTAGSGSLYVTLRESTTWPGVSLASSVAITSASNTTVTFLYTAQSTATVYFWFVGDGVGTTSFAADSASVRELPGNHAVAPTDAARPIYGVEPKGGRRNLLTFSEDFSNAIWTKTGLSAFGSGSVVDATATLDPIGGNTADFIREDTSTGGHSVRQSHTSIVGSSTFSVYVKWPSGVTRNIAVYPFGVGAAGDNRSVIFSPSGAFVAFAGNTGADPAYTAESIGNGWWRFSVTGTATSVQTTTSVGVLLASGTSLTYTGDGTSGIYIWGAQLELGSTATNYQRVTTAYDVTESGVATCHYVQYDGSDDSMSTAAIDFTGTDKMSVFAGVRKLSDASSAVVVELSADWANNIGAFAFTAPDASGTSQYGIALKGSAAGYASISPFAAPITNVVTQLYNIGASTISTELSARVNGNPITLSGATSSAGTGNFGNYPLFIGRRNNATLPFNGRDYGLIIVGKAASAGEITDTETWLAARTAQVTL